ncbi:SMP-30/gluconolactonase/LRE family protein [Aeromicrobium sp. Leaf350]|uniref:SMP-30/gluconolactonase/LRE family protein n=1 Tax=Aeromicrobium sp. Leaf350 TaxID=2876565 RepID=UPI001E608489|nr:SMP-30/gluconolactonase/LRE family protein [Aeromicrobium sp. Leaf350]
MSHDITTVIDGLSFSECPRWHEDRLWFSDFYTSEVSSVLADGSDRRLEATVPNQPSGLGWLPDGRLLVVSMRDQKILRREHDGALLLHADLSQHARGHLNDMTVDAQGRGYVGCFGFDLMGGEPSAAAPLLRVDPDGSVTEVATDLWFPNGIVITPSGTLLVNETFGNRVTGFDVAPDGALENRRVWAELGPLPTEREFEKVLPQVVVAADGSCLDAGGGLWVADATGGRLLRLVDGAIDTEIETGTPVYACALGGPDGTTLFACAAPDFFEHARRDVREASIIALTVDVPAA